MVWGLVESWNALEYDFLDNRGAKLRSTASTPFAALFYYFEMGFYPPPELAFALSDVFNNYTASAGKIKLENAFFGPTRKRAGNFAAREHSKFKWLSLSWDFCKLVENGMSRTKAAEEFSNQLANKIDADSILRKMRGIPPLFTKRAPEK